MSTSTHDLFTNDIYGTQEKIKSFSFFKAVYEELYNIDFKDTFFAFNLIKFDSKKVLDHNYKKIVINYQSGEYFEYDEMYKTFSENKDKVFLLLHDFFSPDAPNEETITNFWPDNVTSIRWLSWSEQVRYFVENAGIADKPRVPTKKLSSLSHRHEFHRAAVTAFIQNNFPKNDVMLSWHNWIPPGDNVYYLEDGYHIHEEIRKHLDTFDYNEKIVLDEPTKPLEYFRNPVKNYFWDSKPYLDCAVNVTNETGYQSIGQIDNNSVVLPTPLITEKIIKPILAGTAFVNVGQPFLLQQFNLFGFRTDFGLPSEYDEEIFEDQRMLKIFDTLTYINDTPIEKLCQDSYEAICHNLNHIRSGKFYENCKNHNKEHVNEIYKWSLIDPQS